MVLVRACCSRLRRLRGDRRRGIPGAAAGTPSRGSRRRPAAIRAAARERHHDLQFERAASIAGSSVTLDAGPAVLAAYGASRRAPRRVPRSALRRCLVRRRLPRARRLSQIEAFMLAQPGIPPQLAEEIRLLGDVQTTLPVPVPSGASVRSVACRRLAGRARSPTPSNAATGVVWEDGSGMLHVVAGTPRLPRCAECRRPNSAERAADRLGRRGAAASPAPFPGAASILEASARPPAASPGDPRGRAEQALRGHARRQTRCR